MEPAKDRQEPGIIPRDRAEKIKDTWRKPAGAGLRPGEGVAVEEQYIDAGLAQRPGAGGPRRTGAHDNNIGFLHGLNDATFRLRGAGACHDRLPKLVTPGPEARGAAKQVEAPHSVEALVVVILELGPGG